MVTALRGQLHQLVDRLPNGDLGAARRYLEYLDVVGGLPMLLADAPEDDSFLSPSEAAALAEAEAQLAQSVLIPDTEFDAAVNRAGQAVRSAL